ncbi:MAG: DHA2 family efflux MFS transporter permease subunit [Acidimicrobiales bacterium]
MAAGGVAWGTAAARWALLAAVLGSGMAFLDGTIVNVALPAIGEDLDADLTGLQWVLDSYLVTLTALVLLGGSLGDRFGRRRIFLVGVVIFVVASAACGAAPTTEALVAARALQGVGGALLVPGSLALLSATIRSTDRSRAVGAWSGLTGVASAGGPLLGGYLVDAASWRLAFLINLPLAVPVFLAARHVPESVDPDAAGGHLDIPGALTAAFGLALLAGGLIEGGVGWEPLPVAAAVTGVALLGLFVVIERRSPDPMLPPALFADRQFTGANLVTFAVYAGLGGALFLVVVGLQVALGYSALSAGLAMLPITLLMLALSARAGALAQRIGPRLPMTIGPLVVALGLSLLAGVSPGDGYVTGVLPGVLVFGLGLAATVAPLTATVLGAVDEHHLGVGSAANNAVARLAGLLAVAVLPVVAGVDIAGAGPEGFPGYATALRIAAALCVVGAGVAAATIRTASPTEPTTQASILQPCQHPCRADDDAPGLEGAASRS